MSRKKQSDIRPNITPEDVGNFYTDSSNSETLSAFEHFVELLPEHPIEKKQERKANKGTHYATPQER